jgi:hypothetical protein
MGCSCFKCIVTDVENSKDEWRFNKTAAFSTTKSRSPPWFWNGGIVYAEYHVIEVDEHFV